MAPVGTESSSARAAADGGLAGACLAALRAAQNKDGGWGFRSQRESRVEPTAWAVLAVREMDSSAGAQRTAFEFLRAAQLPDGSWPASARQTVGCWATSLASWALLGDPDSSNAAAAGLRWISSDWPGSASPFRRIIRGLARGKSVNRQNDRLSGWGWTPGTASWVEPTAFALLALDRAPKNLLPPGAEKRRRLATAMLYDRMCPGGGWNCGNPMVYGVPGDPSIPQTVWALLALRNEQGRTEQGESLRWLEANLAGETRKGAASLALAKICLGAYGRPWPASAPRIGEAAETREFRENVTTMAWMCLAQSPRSAWLKREFC
jgi:hypothetical protein